MKASALLILAFVALVDLAQGQIGKVKITYLKLYTDQASYDDIDANHKYMEFPVTTANPEAWPTCSSVCTDRNYHGKRCSFFAIHNDKCILSDLEYTEILNTAVKKTDPGAIEYRFLNVIDGIPEA